MQKFPFVKYLIPFVSGIYAADFFSANLGLIRCAIVISLSVVLSFFVFKKLKKFFYLNYLFQLFLFVLIFSFSVLYVDYRRVPVPEDYFFNESSFYGVVSEPVEVKSKSYKTKLTVFDSVSQREISISAFFCKDSLLKAPDYGDLIRFTSRVSRIKSSGNPMEFDYAEYMALKGVYCQTFINSSDFVVIQKQYSTGIIYYASLWRDYLLNIYKSYDFNDREFAVLSALTLGYKSELDNETKYAFQAGGAMHILAVSGLHTVIILLVVDKLFFFLSVGKKRKIIKFFITVIVLWTFAAITGFSSSVNRAALMFSFVALSRVSGRKTSIYNSLATSCFILILINPLSIKEIGFRLSYLAVLSIVAILPFIQKYFHSKNKILNYFLELTAVSIAAQIGTGLLSISCFGMFPVYFLLTGFVVIPLSFFIMISAVALIMISAVSWLSSAVAYLLSLSLKILIFSVFAVEDLPCTVIDNIFISDSMMIVLYLILVLLVLFLYYKHTILFKLSVAFSALFCIMIIRDQCLRNNSSIIEIYNAGYGSSVVQFSSNGISEIYYSGQRFENEEDVKQFCNSSAKLLRCGSFLCYNLHTINNVFLQSGDNNVCLLKNEDSVSVSKRVDILILSGNSSNISERTLQALNPSSVVFDSSVPTYISENVISKCNKLKIKYFDVSSSGAYVVGDGREIVYEYD